MIVLLSPAAFRTTLNPIQWTLSTDAAAVAPGKTVLLRLHAEVAPGFHVYSLTTPAGGPIPTVIQLAPNPAVRNSVVYQPKPECRNDPTFNVPIELFLGRTDFLIAATLQDAIAEGVKTSPAKPATRPVATGSVCRPLSIPQKPELRSGRPHSFRHQRSPWLPVRVPSLRQLLLPSRPPASRP